MTTSELLGTPVTTQRIGGTEKAQQAKPPANLNDPQTIQQGMQYFIQFNCVGCHAANGAGGMGPALSNSKFIYGGEPANIFLTIQQGRPKGMPAWGEMLPKEVIWSLVAYVRSISNEPIKSWGKTTSPAGFEIEQVPAETMQTATPWQHTQPFSYGQPPFQKVKTPADTGKPQPPPNQQQPAPSAPQGQAKAPPPAQPPPAQPPPAQPQERKP